MNSLLPDNKSWINRILQKDMCKLLLQAAILAIHLPFICDIPDGFTIKCTYKNKSIACEGSSCGWNGFAIHNAKQFSCYLLEVTGQYSCKVKTGEDPFCTSNEECGFQDGFRNGKCVITRTPDLSKTTPRPDTSTSQAPRNDTNGPQRQQDKGCSANNTDDRMNSGACIEKCTICATIGVLATLALLFLSSLIHRCTKGTWCPGGQNSRAQSDVSELSLPLTSPLTTPTMLLPPTGAVETAQPIRTMAIISEQEGHGTEFGAEPGEEMGEEVGEGGVIVLEKLDGEPNGGEDSGDITTPLRRRSPRSTDDCAPGPGN